MANIASSSLTSFQLTVEGNKRVAYATYTPTTAAGSDTVALPMARVEFVTGGFTGTTAPDAACVVVFAATTAGVVVANTTHANHPVSFRAVGF